MTKNEKELIYNLLKSADANLYGYTRDKFSTTPDFSDDGQILSAEKQINAQTEVLEKHNDGNSGLKLNELNEKIIRCTRCGLARTRTNVVPGQGVENPKVLVIGEGPGYEEDQQGLPFVGKAGHLLDKMLAAIDLSRSTNCYIANIVK